MPPSRLETGQSDPVDYTCTCPASSSSSGGLVLLFYRYFANRPSLPCLTELTNSESLPLATAKLKDLADFHTGSTDSLNLIGKIRISPEGFNITVGGTTPAIHSYILACSSHWSFAGLSLSTEKERREFFKPTRGCACVFKPAERASIRICEEVTPFGISGYTPKDWDTVEEIGPEEWHRRCHNKSDSEDEPAKKILLDLRNGYESRIGYFVDPETEDGTVRPSIRRFSQWPRWVRTGGLEKEISRASTLQQHEEVKETRQVMAYCTGGVRCEKATRWLAETLRPSVPENTLSIQSGMDVKVCTLRGGIAAYITWMDSEIAACHKTPSESLFRGRNYVFDARGSVALMSVGVDEGTQKVAQCHGCGKSEDRLGKCKSPGCHLVLVICTTCEDRKTVVCCNSCKEKDLAGMKNMCDCERLREESLWGTEADIIRRALESKAAARRTKKKPLIDIGPRII